MGAFVLRKNELSLPFLMTVGIKGYEPSKIEVLQLTLKSLIQQEVILYSNPIICFFICLLSMMKICYPPPSIAPLRIISKLTPLPIPTACVVLILSFFIIPINLITYSTLKTCPSVNKITCLRQWLICLSFLTISFKGAAIQVPPKSASKDSIFLIVYSRFQSLQATLFLNIRQKLLPKLMMLQIEFQGSDFRKRMRDYLAFWILSPPIDPERSSKKMYQPLQRSKFDFVDFGGKKVRLRQESPTVHIGLSYCSCSKVNYRSFQGNLSQFKLQLLNKGVKTDSVSL